MARSRTDLVSAVIGTGFIGVVHVEAARRAGAHVAGVLGSSPGRAQPQARRLGVPRVYADLDELCGDTSVDVVHVTSPNALHVEQALRLLEAGKHVVCEKPLALDAVSGRTLLDAATQAGVVHAVCFNARFYPVLHEARARVRSGGIGTPRLVHGSYLQDWLLHDTDWNWRLDPGVAGPTRAVADIGSHWLDLLRFVSGLRVEAVCADLHTIVPVRWRPEGEVETFAGKDADGGGPGRPERTRVEMTSDNAAGILLRLSDGARGLLAVSQVSAGRKNSIGIEVDGSDGSLAWSSESPESLWLGHRGATNEVLLRDPAHLDASARAVTFYPGGHVEGFGETFRGLFERVYDDVAAGAPAAEPAYPTFEDGLEGLLVEEAIRTSAQTGAWCPVERRSEG